MWPVMTAVVAAQVLVWGLIGIGFVGMVVCARIEKWTNLVFPFLALLVIGVVALLVMTYAPGHPESKVVMAENYTRIAAQVLGEHLAQAVPGTKALVIAVDPQSDEAKAQLEGLRSGLAGAIEIIAVTSPRESAANAAGAAVTPEKLIHQRRMIAADSFDRLIDLYPDCNLIISFMGLPRNPAAMAVWRRDPERRPRFALLAGDIRPCRDAILSGAICAAIATRPDYSPEQDAVTKDPRKAFDRRFLLVTPENAEQLDEQHHLFAE